MVKIASRFAPSVLRATSLLELAYSPAHPGMSDEAMVLFSDTQERARNDFETIKRRGHGLMPNGQFFDSVLDCVTAQHIERVRIAKDRAARHEAAIAKKEEALYA